MHDLIAVGGSRTFRGEPYDETLDVAPQLQQDALALEIDRCDLEALSRADNNEGISRQPTDCLMHWRSPKASYLLQILHGKEATRFQFASDNKIFNPFVG
jgi:hypothetical protein